MIRIAIIGEYDETFRPHTATNEALVHAMKQYGVNIEYDWISTENISADTRKNYNGFWIAPGSPYKNMQGALQIIQYAREHQVPVLGTCGGFQHMVIEFARHVLFIKEAQHAEYDPYASDLVITPLSCSLKGQTLEIAITRRMSKTFKAYQSDKVLERYYCNFGLNPAHQQQIHYAGLQVVGMDEHKEARILELANHPFFIATLFVPQDNSSVEKPHPLILAFVQAVGEGIMVKLN